MSTSPFDLFPTTSYTFLRLASGSGGNKIVSQTDTDGIVKFREGLQQSANREAFTSQTTLHMRPSEPFIATVGGHEKLVGHGVRINDEDYRIEGVRAGQDLAEGITRFYLCTLKKESLWLSALPLE